jgi:hypothetical protein
MNYGGIGTSYPELVSDLIDYGLAGYLPSWELASLRDDKRDIRIYPHPHHKARTLATYLRSKNCNAIATRAKQPRRSTNEHRTYMMRQHVETDASLNEKIERSLRGKHAANVRWKR